MRSDEYRPGGRLGWWELKGPRTRLDLLDGQVVVIARYAGRGGAWLRLSWQPTRFVWFAEPPSEK